MKEDDRRNKDDKIQRTKDRRAMLWRMEEEDAQEQIQAKLEIGASDNVHEQHADAVAKKVVSGEDASTLVKNQPSVNTISAKSEDGSLTGTDQLQTTLNSSKGGGQNLDTNTQNEMGEKMGADLSDVKIHTDSKAHEMSEGINAKAFTHGQDIYFKQGNFNTTSTEGKSLLAHELTHTVQQKGGIQPKIQRVSEEYVKGEDLQSIWFKDIPELEAAFDGTLVFGHGSAGLYVQRIQLAMLKLQRLMGVKWLDETGKKFLVDLGPKGDDGDFGDYTLKSMIGVQKKFEMKSTNGNVGPETMGILDKTFFRQKELPVSYNQLKEEEKIHQAIPKTEYYSYGRIGATLETYADIASTGKNIYDVPSGKKTFKILYGETVNIYAYSDDWYEIAYKGKVGWVQKDYVKDPFPIDDEFAELYFVQSGENLGDIVAKHYADIDEEHNDLRLLVFAVAKANVGRTGVSINIEEGIDSLSGFEKMLLSDNSEQAQAIWRTVQVKAGTNIWLPSKGKIYSMTMEGLISAGSMFEDVMEDLEVLAYFIMGFFEGLIQSIIDLFVGIYELGKLAYKVIELLAHPNKMVLMFALVLSLDWEEVKAAILAIPGAIWDDFTGKWNSPVRTEAAEFRGKVIGYIVMEIILAIFTAGIFTEVKWVSFVLSKLGKTGDMLMTIINGTRNVLGKEIRATRYADELARIEKNKAIKQDNIPADKKDGTLIEKIILHGIEYTVHYFGKLKTKIYSSIVDGEIFYHFPDKIVPDKSPSFASFSLENGVFKSGIALPVDFRGSSIGKDAFVDAFNRLGGKTGIKKIFGEWGQGPMGDNFKELRDALIAGATGQDAVFKTHTGAWAKELGYGNIEPISDVIFEQIKNGNIRNIEIYFIP